MGSSFAFFLFNFFPLGSSVGGTAPRKSIKRGKKIFDSHSGMVSAFAVFLLFVIIPFFFHSFFFPFFFPTPDYPFLKILSPSGRLPQHISSHTTYPTLHIIHSRSFPSPRLRLLPRRHYWVEPVVVQGLTQQSKLRAIRQRRDTRPD